MEECQCRDQEGLRIHFSVLCRSMLDICYCLKEKHGKYLNVKRYVFCKKPWHLVKNIDSRLFDDLMNSISFVLIRITFRQPTHSMTTCVTGAEFEESWLPSTTGYCQQGSSGQPTVPICHISHWECAYLWANSREGKFLFTIVCVWQRREWKKGGRRDSIPFPLNHP